MNTFSLIDPLATNGRQILDGDQTVTTRNTRAWFSDTAKAAVGAYYEDAPVPTPTMLVVEWTVDEADVNEHGAYLLHMPRIAAVVPPRTEERPEPQIVDWSDEVRQILAT